MTLARTPDGYKSTYNIRKGDILLSNGEWIEAESDSVEVPCTQYTFSDNTHTCSRHRNIRPKSCNIPIPLTSSDKSTFVKGWCIQNEPTFPMNCSDKTLLLGFIKLTMSIPKLNKHDTYTIPQPDLSHGYSNSEITDILNGILYRNINTNRRSTTVWYNHPLKDSSIQMLRLASITTNENEMSHTSFPVLIRELYNSLTDIFIDRAVRIPIINYTDDKFIVNETPSIMYGLPNQDIDINNFSTI